MNEMLHKIISLKSGILKKTIRQSVTLFAAVIFSLPAIGQKTSFPKPPLKRCGTMEALRAQMLTDPELRARIAQGERDYQNSLRMNGGLSRPASPLSLPDSVVIPVVVHVVLPNPWMITDDAVEYFINRLNLDYSGLNPDSTNAGTFLPIRGHSRLRFTLARRDPNGNFTTGIVRKFGTTQIAGGTNQPIKKSTTPTGGSTGWDVTKYYNLYVGDGGAAGLLGISPGIGPGGPAGSNNADGVCVDYRSFGPNCFSYPEYNMSRTAVHEIGHNFGLYHPFDDGCATNDFSQLSSAGCSLPPALLAPADDVPHQSNATRGCPASAINTGCTPVEPRMFQNYMDYTEDACYSMFSKGEVKRMEWVLENCRSGYLTTLGGRYPDNTADLDAAVNSVVSPGGADFDDATCKGNIYPAQTCPGSFMPRLRITNAGMAILTSITVTASINGLNSITVAFPVNIRPGKSTIIEMDPLNAVPGPNALRFILSAPNGGIDGNAANDTLTLNFDIAPELLLPYTENFTATAFPPPNGFSIINPDADTTWKRTTAAGKPGPSMRIHLFEYANTGQRDIFRTSSVNTTQFDSIGVSFYVAHRQYPAASDSLKIIYSSDCGATWYPAGYAKGSATLSTVEGTSDLDFVPTATQWRRDSVILQGFCEAGIKSIQIGFESYNDYGNNIYVDSIDIEGFKSVKRDAKIESVSRPQPALCATAVNPQVTFSNAGLDTLESLQVHYRIDDGPVLSSGWTGKLGKCDIGIINLPSSSATIGTHRLVAYISDPNDSTDLKTLNDTLTKTFTIYSSASLPVAIDFEDPLFPPANWGVQNVNGPDWGIRNATGGTTWERTTATARSGIGSMWINNPAPVNGNSAVDYFVSPIIKNSAFFDSLSVSFDLSYRAGPQYPGSTVFPLDTLEVMATTDCGASFISVWKKWGNELQTVNDPNYSTIRSFVPMNQEEWKHNTVNLKQFIGASDFQLYFAAKSNRQNNIWIDNINIVSLQLPQRLKDQGYLIYPNPFNSSFLIHHSASEPPFDLQSVQVYNSAGQTVWLKEYNENAPRQITVDLKSAASGVYILKMIYTDRTVIERIVKH